jgi:hypothetical protein
VAGSAPPRRAVTDPDAPRAAGQWPGQREVGRSGQFTEIRQSTNRFEAERGDWVQQLARYVQTTAAKPLQPGRPWT